MEADFERLLPIEEEAHLRRVDTERLVGLKKSALYALIKLGKFPKPVKRSPRCARWRARDVRAWLVAQGAAE